MSDTFEVFDDEDLRIRLIMNKYLTRKRKTMPPSPYSLFFLDKGEDIIKEMNKENGQRPKPDDAMKRIPFEWRRISEYDRSIYLRASYKLNYNPKSVNTKEFLKRIHRKTRVNQLREFLKLFTF